MKYYALIDLAQKVKNSALPLLVAFLIKLDVGTELAKMNLNYVMFYLMIKVFAHQILH